MLSRIGREIQRWINRQPWRRNRDPEPQEPPQDAPQPQPEPTPAPALPAPIIDPSRLCIWCEASGAYDRGIRSAIVWALRGKAGAQNIRIAHPWYDPWKTRINYEEWLRRLTAARNEGCVAFGIDTEGWLYDVQVCSEAYAAAQAVGIKLLHVPKASIGLGPTPPYHWLDRDFPNSVKVLEQYSDGCWLWNYGLGGEGYRDITRQWRAAGYTKQIGWIQDQVRDHNGFHGARLWRSVVDAARADGVSFMLFAGNHSTPQLIDELRGYYP